MQVKLHKSARKSAPNGRPSLYLKNQVFWLLGILRLEQQAGFSSGPKHQLQLGFVGSVSVEVSVVLVLEVPLDKTAGTKIFFGGGCSGKTRKISKKSSKEKDFSLNPIQSSLVPNSTIRGAKPN